MKSSFQNLTARVKCFVVEQSVDSSMIRENLWVCSVAVSVFKTCRPVTLQIIAAHLLSLCESSFCTLGLISICLRNLIKSLLRDIGKLCWLINSATRISRRRAWEFTDEIFSLNFLRSERSSCWIPTALQFFWCFSRFECLFREVIPSLPIFKSLLQNLQEIHNGP